MQDKSLFDRVVNLIVLGVVGWMGYTVQNLSVDVAVLTEKSEQSYAERYTSSEANVRTYLVDQRLDILSVNQDEILDKLDTLERQGR